MTAPPPNMRKTNDMNGRTFPAGSTPVPDPTVLTTQQLVREIAASREILEAKYDTRLAAMDTATELNKSATDKIPHMIDEKICQLRKLNDEKFAGVEKQFLERDTRTDKIAELGQKALEAALSAAKEAVGKTEVSFTKQIDTTLAQIQAEKKATDDKFEDVKGRLTTLESSINTRQTVVTETRGQSNVNTYLVVVSIGIIISITISLISLFIHMPK